MENDKPNGPTRSIGQKVKGLLSNGINHKSSSMFFVQSLSLLHESLTLRYAPGEAVTMIRECITGSIKSRELRNAFSRRSPRLIGLAGA